MDNNTKFKEASEEASKTIKARYGLSAYRLFIDMQAHRYFLIKQYLNAKYPEVLDPQG